MPVYDYKCKNCDKIFTFYHTISEDEKFDKKCPECNKFELEKYFQPGIVLSKPKIEKDSSKYGGIFSKKFWRKNTWV